MTVKQRWTEWVAGVTVSHDAPGGVLARRIKKLKWKWLRVSTTALPWCPNCGSVVAPPRHKYQGQTAMQIHEQWCAETDDEDIEDGGEVLQLESGEEQ